MGLVEKERHKPVDEWGRRVGERWEVVSSSAPHLPFCLFLLSPECLEDERIRGRMETKKGRVTLQRCLCENAMNEFRHGGRGEGGGA